MNHLQIFSYKEKPVRTIEREDGFWWVLKDVCSALGIANHKNVAARIDEDEKGVHLVDSPGGTQEMTVINEPGLYNVIFRSDKPEGKDFKRWVTHEVLPAVRRTGTYSISPAPQFVSLPEGVTLSSVVGLIRVTRRAMLDMGSGPVEVGAMIAQTLGAVNFPVPPALSKQIPGQIDLFGRSGLEIHPAGGGNHG